MKKTKANNTNNGITLIALVITIIVMLILVSVTISMAINGGLFNKAGEAVGKMQNEIDKEKEIANGEMEITVGDKKYNSIDEYLEDLNGGGGTTPEEPEGPEHEWTRSGDTFTCSKHAGETYTMGQKVNYVPDGTTTSTMITEAKNGYGDQTVERQTSNWVVLGIEDTDRDGTKETLLITTESPVSISGSNTLILQGAAPYEYVASYYDASGNKVEGEIDRVCRLLYSNSEHGEARGMTIDDVSEALNYTDVGTQIGGMYHDGLKWNSVGNLTTKLKDLPAEYWSAIKGACFTPASPKVKDETGFGNYELNGYYYYLNSGKTAVKNDANSYEQRITPIEKKIIFGISADYVYWLASRGVHGYDSFAIFGSGYVSGGYASSCYGLIHSYDDEDLYGALLRPVVSIKSTIPEVIVN